MEMEMTLHSSNHTHRLQNRWNSPANVLYVLLASLKVPSPRATASLAVV